MKKILLKIFIKDYQNTTSLKVKKAYGLFACIFNLITNALISILKIAIGFIFNMISFIGDGINNLSDAFSSIIGLVSFKIAFKPADKAHPFGHARMEYIASFIIVLFIDFIGIELIIESINKIIENESINYNLNFFIISLVILGFSLLIKIFQCYLNYSLAKDIKSSTLKLTALDSRNDIIATFVIIIGLIISYFSKISLDGYLGVCVGLFILISSLKSINESVNNLLGQKIDQDIIDTFIKKIKSYENVLGIHDLQFHSYGLNYIFATCHVEVDSNMDLITANELMDKIENDIQKELKIHTVLHIDPLIRNNPEVNQAKFVIKTIIDSYNCNLKYHDLRLIKGPTFINVIFDLVINENLKIKENELINQIITTAKTYDARYRLIIKIDHDFEDEATSSEE